MAELLNPQDLSKEAAAEYAKKHFPEAAEAYERAAAAFTQSDRPLDAAEAANNASVAWLQANEPQKALDLANGTEAAFQAAGDTRREGMAIANQAAALEALHRLPEALQRYQASSDLLKQAGETELRAMVLSSISKLQLRSGNHLQALASMDASLEGKKRLSLKDRLLRGLLKTQAKLLNRE